MKRPAKHEIRTNKRPDLNGQSKEERQSKANTRQRELRATRRAIKHAKSMLRTVNTGTVALEYNELVSRERIAKEADPIGFLINVTQGRAVLASLPKALKKRVMVFPQLRDRIVAAVTLTNKILPDLKSVDMTVDPSGKLTINILKMTTEADQRLPSRRTVDVTPVEDPNITGQD